VALDYRLAPENPYPAAVDDTVDALKFIYYNGKAEFNANVNKIAVGGSSRYVLVSWCTMKASSLFIFSFSGGNLAAIACLKAQELTPPIPIIFQLLIVPGKEKKIMFQTITSHLLSVTDNTASVADGRYPSWKELQNTVWLSEGRMMWFRNMYLPDPATWAEPDNSPIFASDAALAKVPPALVCVCELDLLRDEGIAYGEKLRSLGVKVDIKVYPRAPHQILGMDAALKVGKQQADDAIKAVGDAFKAA